MIINLNVHSEYSFLESTIKLTAYLEFAKSNQLKVLALTDKNNMFGALEFYELCQKNNIKPLLGVDIDVCDVKRQIKYELVIIANNNAGYQQLCLLTSVLNSNKKQIIIDSELEQYLTDVVVIFKPQNNKVLAITDQLAIVKKIAQKTTIYSGIGFENWEMIEFWINNQQLVVPCPLVKYLQSADKEKLQTLSAIKNQHFLGDELGVKTNNYEYWIEFQLNTMYQGALLQNLEKLVNAVNLELIFNVSENQLRYLVPQDYTSVTYLQQLCFSQLKKHSLLAKKPQYWTRLEHELKIITQMGFADYFLIVWDYVKYAHQNKIMIGPGRGSVAGSLVAYLLEISTVDPLVYGLIFERFLNPERISMPDIDIDFQDDQREIIIQYLVDKYGRDHVAQIITFQVISCKVAFRDVGRILKINLDIIDKIAKAVPLEFNHNLAMALAKTPLLQIYKQEYQQLFRLVAQIVGYLRNFSTHAAGIILSQIALKKIVPLQIGHNNWYLTQYSMNYLLKFGLLKMDLLGLKTLTIFKQVINKIQTTKGLSIDLARLPLTDLKTYQLLRLGNTTGVFQLESRGMQQLLMMLAPQKFEDIVAVNALFRPGPQDSIKLYINRKLGREAITYLHSDLGVILEATYGVILYQEQILLIAQKIANFSLSKADILRRAIGKKDHLEMVGLKNQFVQGALVNGYEIGIVKKIYQDIQQFASYGFNRSHAVAYSLLSYWGAFLKANFTTEFMVVLLNNVISSLDKVIDYLKICQQLGVIILPPTINCSAVAFEVETGKIRFGFGAIKKLDREFALAITAERTAEGPFTDYLNFVARMTLKGLNSSRLELLIASGALDEFSDLTRATMQANKDIVLRYAKLIQIKTNATIKLDYELVSKPNLILKPDHLLEKAQNEQQALGFFLQTKPLNEIAKKFQLKTKFHNFTNLNNLTTFLNRNIKVLAWIKSQRQIMTKKGTKMGFITIYDDYEIVDMTLFGSVFQQYYAMCETEKLFLIDAVVTKYQQKISLILKKLEVIKFN